MNMKRDRQIEIGWQLEFFPQKLRNTVFKEETNRWAEMDAKLLAVEKAAGGLKDVELDPEEKTDEEARKSVAAFSKDVKNLSKQFGKYREKVDKAVTSFEYLAAEKPRKTGQIAWERYDNIPGSSVPELTGAVKYPDQPDAKGTYEKLESAGNIGDNYGLRLHGYLLPPKSGKYQFYKESDDGSEFWISKDDDPANLKRVMAENQTSQGGPTLKEGEVYYIQALLKEGGGGDFVRIGWKWPDGKEEKPPCPPFPGICQTAWTGSSRPWKMRRPIYVLLHRFSLPDRVRRP